MTIFEALKLTIRNLKVNILKFFIIFKLYFLKFKLFSLKFFMLKLAKLEFWFFTDLKFETGKLL